MQFANRNWFGIEPHETDTMIHWREKNPQAKAVKLRAAYDKLAAVDKEALDYLLQEKWEEGHDDGYDQAQSEYDD